MNLRQLTDHHLLNKTSSLACEERALLSQLLWHLREIDHRKLYSDLKCGSLFEYCIRVLKYSEGQASRRVSASRLLKELPEISEKIESGDLNLMQLNQAKYFFNDEDINNKQEKIKILNEISGKTVKETEKSLDGKRKNPLNRKVDLKLKQETIDTIKKAQALKPHLDLDTLLTQICHKAIEAWNPIVIRRKSTVTESNTRYIPKQVKSYVWERDRGKCRNCGSTFALQLDHKMAFAKGGKATIDNMQLLCRNCNQRKGRIEF